MSNCVCFSKAFLNSSVDLISYLSFCTAFGIGSHPPFCGPFCGWVNGDDLAFVPLSRRSSVQYLFKETRAFFSRRFFRHPKVKYTKAAGIPHFGELKIANQGSEVGSKNGSRETEKSLGILFQTLFQHPKVKYTKAASIFRF